MMGGAGRCEARGPARTRRCGSVQWTNASQSRVVGLNRGLGGPDSGWYFRSQFTGSQPGAPTRPRRCSASRAGGTAVSSLVQVVAHTAMGSADMPKMHPVRTKHRARIVALAFLRLACVHRRPRQTPTPTPTRPCITRAARRGGAEVVAGGFAGGTPRLPDRPPAINRRTRSAPAVHDTGLPSESE